MVRIYNASNWHLSFLRAKHSVENLSFNVLELEVYSLNTSAYKPKTEINIIHAKLLSAFF